MSFSPIELRAITEFQRRKTDRPEWRESPVAYLHPTAPSTKGQFARQLMGRLAKDAGLPFAPVPGRHGNRRLIGTATCEIKFSMESPARFQQVRPPTDEYDYLVGICIQPATVRYWLIPASDVTLLFEDERITFQHAESSRWFRAELEQSDAFSGYRFTQKDFVEALTQLG